MLNFDSRGQLDDPAKKRRFNRRLFAEIAPKYDFVTRALSLGRDQAWKRALLAALPEDLDQPRCLDLACGTGDLCLGLAARYPGSRIVGIDLCEEMLALAAKRGDEAGAAVEWRCADMAETGEADGEVDLLTGAYALRNAPELGLVLAEAARTLRPGGHAAFLDFSRSPKRLAASLQFAVLKLWGSLWGLLLHRDPAVYGYIAASLATFPDREQLEQRLAEAGFVTVRSKLYCFGLLQLLVVRKDKEEGETRCPPVGTG